MDDCRTLFVSSAGLENAKSLITDFKEGRVRDMNPQLWQAKKVVDSTLHPGMLVCGGKMTEGNSLI